MRVRRPTGSLSNWPRFPLRRSCRTAARCCDYPGRKRQVPDCVKLTPKLAFTLSWLPDTCAYRLRADNTPLRDWHYLVSGDPEAVHTAGISVRGKVIGEQFAGPLEEHIILPPGVELADD